MFQIDKNTRRLTIDEINQYEDDGYITGLPVFSSKAKYNLDKLFVNLSSRVDDSIDLNKTAQWHKAVVINKRTGYGIPPALWRVS